MSKKKVIRKKSVSKKRVVKKKPGVKKGSKNTKVPKVKGSEKKKAERQCNVEEESFVWEYIQNFNALDAWRTLNKPEKNSNQATKAAFDMKNRPCVKRRINELLEMMRDEREESIFQVIRELKRIAFFDPQKFFNDEGQVKAISEMDDEVRAVIQGIETIKIIGDLYRHKYKIASKENALKELVKVLGIGSETLKIESDTLKAFIDGINGDSSGPPGLT